MLDQKQRELGRSKRQWKFRPKQFMKQPNPTTTAIMDPKTVKLKPAIKTKDQKKTVSFSDSKKANKTDKMSNPTVICCKLRMIV